MHKIEMTGTEKRERIVAGLEKAYQKLLLFKKEKNSPLIVSKDGNVVELSVNEMQSRYSARGKKQ